MNPEIVLDRFAEMFCTIGATALVLGLLVIALLWIVCEGERLRFRGR
jgi:hypothetical protein